MHLKKYQLLLWKLSTQLFVHSSQQMFNLVPTCWAMPRLKTLLWLFYSKNLQKIAILVCNYLDSCCFCFSLLCLALLFCCFFPESLYSFHMSWHHMLLCRDLYTVLIYKLSYCSWVNAIKYCKMLTLFLFQPHGSYTKQVHWLIYSKCTHTCTKNCISAPWRCFQGVDILFRSA